MANADEAETEYGLLAKVIELPADRMGVAFELRPEAKFHDGTPVTAEDVAWTFKTLREKGRPFYPPVLRRCRLGDGRRPAARGVPLQVRHQPRAAADPRPDAGAAEALVGRAASSTSR